MSNISITIRHNLQGVDKDLEKAIRLGLDDTLRLIRRKASRYAPYDTGTLRRSLNYSIGLGGKSGMVGSNQPYARIREFVNYKNPHTKYYLRRAGQDSMSVVDNIFNARFDSILVGKGI